MDKVIKTELEYEAALAEIENLIDIDPERGTPEADRLELLALLAQDYELRNFPFELPDPVEAIEFRMEQQELTNRDLLPYIGSRSKVSEVLSRKRPLTLSMIRALSSLGIPARVLIQQPVVSESNFDVDWEQFPTREMIKRGWIKVSKASGDLEDQLREFFAPFGLPRVVQVLYKQTDYVRSARPMDKYALAAWTVRVMNRARENPPSSEFKPGTVTYDFMRQVARLSASSEGALLAREFLSKNGISLVIEPHLARTHLDGAAILVNLDRPVIGMTLRYDRIDNFWFCLMHELAHVSLHLGGGVSEFYDDLDLKSDNDPREQEADKTAGEALIPREEWIKSPASRLRNPDAVQHLANKLSIHPAIVAGRMRHEYKSYRVLNQLIGHGEVRRHFPEINWT